MTLFSRARHPRWIRALVAAGFIASIATGASLGLDQRVEPATVASGTSPVALVRPNATRHLPAHPVAFYVVPQAPEYTPYGTRVTIPQIGIPANISLVTGPNSAEPQLTCNLIAGTISESVLVTDAEGNPVSGAFVQFSVIRSDVDDPQLVSDVTGFDGMATVSVKVPTAAANGSVATYSILAEAYRVDSATPVASLRFAINDYTCTGGTGAK